MSITFTRGENPLRADKLNGAFSERIARGGDSMDGPLLLAHDPATALEAATKRYVDNFTPLFRPKFYVDVTTPTYTTQLTDEFIAVNSVVPVTITLGNTSALGTTQTISDIGRHANTANINVVPTSGTIGGFANVLMTQAGMALSFTFTSAGWVIG